jgi:hypothetical protein
MLHNHLSWAGRMFEVAIGWISQGNKQFLVWNQIIELMVLSNAKPFRFEKCSVSCEEFCCLLSPRWLYFPISRYTFFTMKKYRFLLNVCTLFPDYTVTLYGRRKLHSREQVKCWLLSTTQTWCTTLQHDYSIFIYMLTTPNHNRFNN